jgi:hypothetical protein
VTDERRREEHLRDLKESLERAVAERTRERDSASRLYQHLLVVAAADGAGGLRVQRPEP